MGVANCSKRSKNQEMRIFDAREGERAEQAWGSIGGHGVVQLMPKGHALLALEVWLKGWRLWSVCVLENFTLQAFHESLKSFFPKFTH